MCLVGTVLAIADIVHFHHARKFYWTVPFQREMVSQIVIASDVFQENAA